MATRFAYATYPYVRSPDQDAAEPAHHAVIVAGGGLVGLTMAVDMAVRGHDVLVLDDNDRVSVGSRSICVAKRSLEIFDRLGIGARCAEKGVVWEDNPKLFYLGMQDQYYTFNMFDAQAWFARDVILGRIKLPTKATMRKHSKLWEAKEAKIVTPKDAWEFQADNIRELLAATDYPNFDIDGVNQLLYEWKNHKKEDIMNFRDNAYRSVMTGKMSPKHHTKWMKAMDDSLKSYLKSK